MRAEIDRFFTPLTHLTRECRRRVVAHLLNSLGSVLPRKGR